MLKAGMIRAIGLTISIVVRNEDNELPARQAGATTVINPVSFAGLLLAGSTSATSLAHAQELLEQAL